MNDHPLTFVFILALGHSGSTLLQKLLALDPQVWALGEIASVFTGKEDTVDGTGAFCSCGKPFTECEFWSRFVALGPAHDMETLYERYSALVEYARTHGARAVVDSSSPTALGALARLAREGRCELKVVYLIREPEGWVASNKRLCRDVYVGAKRFFKCSAPRLLYTWSRVNADYARRGEASGAPMLVQSYANLARMPHESLERIRTFLDLPAPPQIALRGDAHHAFGNKAKYSIRGVEDVRYDDRWKSDWGVRFWVGFALAPFVRASKAGALLHYASRATNTSHEETAVETKR